MLYSLRSIIAQAAPCPMLDCSATRTRDAVRAWSCLQGDLALCAFHKRTIRKHKGLHSALWVEFRVYSKFCLPVDSAPGHAGSSCMQVSDKATQIAGRVTVTIASAFGRSSLAVILTSCVAAGVPRRALQVAAQGKQGHVDKAVLAYSGGLDTSVILKWLKEEYQCEVITFTADLGQVRACRQSCSAASFAESMPRRADTSRACQLATIRLHSSRCEQAEPSLGGHYVCSSCRCSCNFVSNDASDTQIDRIQRLRAEMYGIAT